MVHQVGAGVHGPVFKGEDPSTGRNVAIKTFPLDITPEQASEFASSLERLTVASLAHPSIVQPIAAGSEGSTVYLAQDYVFAESVDVAIRQYGPAPVPDALRLVGQLAGALDFAAVAGVHHGALHPRDILVAPNEVRMTGLGVAQALEQVGVRLAPRRPYSAPERHAPGPWGSPADVFSLAGVAFELLTGRRPGSLDAVAAESRTIQASDRALLGEVFARALSRRAEDRYQSALPFAAALRHALTGEPLDRPDVAPLPAAAQSSRRGRAPSPRRAERAPETGEPSPGITEPAAAALESPFEADRDSIPVPLITTAEEPIPAPLVEAPAPVEEPARPEGPTALGEPARSRLDGPAGLFAEEPPPPRVEEPPPPRVEEPPLPVGEPALPPLDEHPPPSLDEHPPPSLDEPAPLPRDEPAPVPRDEPAPLPAEEARPAPAEEPARTAVIDARSAVPAEDAAILPVEDEPFTEPALELRRRPAATGSVLFSDRPEMPEAEGPTELGDVREEIASGIDESPVVPPAGPEAAEHSVSRREAERRAALPVVPPASRAEHAESLFARPEMPVMSEPHRQPPSRSRFPLSSLLAMLLVGLFAGFTVGYLVGRGESPSEGPAEASSEAKPAEPRVAGPTESATPGQQGSAERIPAAPALPPPATETAAPGGPEAGTAKAPATPPARPPASVARGTSSRAPARRSTPSQKAAAPPARPGVAQRFEAPLAVVSRPPGALVRLDGRPVGKTPLTLKAVSAGSHVVRLELEGYRPWSSAIQVSAGRTNRVTASLEQRPGGIE